MIVSMPGVVKRLVLGVDARLLPAYRPHLCVAKGFRAVGQPLERMAKFSSSSSKTTLSSSDNDSNKSSDRDAGEDDKKKDSNVNGGSREQGASENAGDVDAIGKLQQTLSEKEAKYKELQASYLVTLADMENLRMRTRRELENASNHSISRFAKDLLQVVDVLETALSSVCPSIQPKEQGKKDLPREDEQEDPSKALRDFYGGVEMTLHELRSVLKRHGIESFDSLHQAFDPHVHQALFHVPPANPSAKDKVIAVQKKGYRIKDRILRHAHVGVAK